MKKQVKRWISLLLAVLTAISVTVFGVSAKTEDRIETMLNAMTTEEKITQMFMIALRYYDNVGITQLNEPFENLLSRYAFGGVILFAQNTTNARQTLRLTDSIQNANAKPGRSQLFISIDQEGGSVSRLATGTQMTGNMALGAVGQESAAYTSGNIIGEELSSLGIHVDFAPVMDINDNPANPVIGTRSFSDDPETVASLGRGFIEGLHNSGVMTALKHFPGHGNTATDSHTGLPLITKSYSELKNCELIPFSAGIDAGTEMIMTAHIQYPNIESKTYVSKLTGEKVYLPATLSKTIITDILRRDMGYNGIVVTDSMTMAAVDKHFDKLDSIELAINAGVDILLMPNKPYTDADIEALENIIAGTVSRVENGTISMDCVNAAVRRILTLKNNHGMLNEYKTGNLDERIAQANATVGSKAHHDAEFEIAKRSITLTKNENDLLPLRTENQNVLILTAYPNELLSVDYGRSLAADNSIIPKGTKISIGCYGNTSSDTISEQIQRSDVVIAISELTKAAGLDPKTSVGALSANIDRMIETAHSAGAKFIVLSARLPYDCVRFPKADAVMLCWSDMGMNADPRELEHDIPQYGPCIPAAIYMMFNRNGKIEGRLPVNVPEITESYTFSDKTAFERGYGLTYKENFCPICGETHEKNLWDHFKGFLHRILFFLRKIFVFTRIQSTTVQEPRGNFYVPTASLF